MLKISNIVKEQIGPSFLVLLLVFPLLTGLLHDVTDHDHPICDDISTHLHATPVDCDLCDYATVAFNLVPESEMVLIKEAYVAKTVTIRSQFAGDPQLELFKGRGPPTV